MREANDDDINDLFDPLQREADQDDGDDFQSYERDAAKVESFFKERDFDVKERAAFDDDVYGDLPARLAPLQDRALKSPKPAGKKPLVPGVARAMRQCKLNRKKTKRSLWRRTGEKLFVMEGDPVEADFTKGEKLTTIGLCGCWVVAIIAKDGKAFATHM